jgi:hypothetical protein
LFSPEVNKFLIDEFTKNGRQHLFDKLIENFKLEKTFIKDALFILRNYEIDYNLELSFMGLSLRHSLFYNKKKITILTNCNVEQQKNRNSFYW